MGSNHRELIPILSSYKSRVHQLGGYSTHLMATSTQLQSLRQAISFDHPPLCSGAISPPSEGLYLYYGKRNPRYIPSPLYALSPTSNTISPDLSISPRQNRRNSTPSLLHANPLRLVVVTRMSTTNPTARPSRCMPLTSTSNSTS